jgi:hypothetical protein
MQSASAIVSTHDIDLFPRASIKGAEIQIATCFIYRPALHSGVGIENVVYDDIRKGKE